MKLHKLMATWNQLDIIIVLLSIVGIILEEMETNVIPINPTIIRVMRVLRIARVLKLLKMAKGIRALLDTVIQALPQVGNLGLLFFLLFFIFAALGVELFGRLECSEIHICEGLGEHAHFRNFGMAFLTLFRVATGDNWNGIMKDTLRVDCDGSDNCIWNCCVSSIIAPVYFVIFVLMAQFVLVNVVVAVLMKHLEETYKFNEIEEEVRLEILAIQKQQKRDVQESHKQAALDLEDEEFFAAPISETGVLNNENKEDPESVEQVPDEIPDECVTNEETKNPVSLPTNFTFNLRPPSPDQKTQNSKEGFPASIPMVTINFDGSPERISRCSGAASPSVIYSQSSAKKQSKQKPYKLRRSPVTRSQSCKQRHSRSLHSSIPNIRRIADNQQHASSQPSLNVPKGRWAGVAVVEDHSPTPSRLKRCNTEKTGRVAGRPFLKRRNVKSQEEVSLTNEDSLDNGSDDYCEDSLMNDWLDDEAECDEEVKLITGDDEDDDICPTLSLYNVADPRQSTDPLLSKTDSKQTMDQRLLSQPVIDNRDRLLTRPIINERLMPARPLIDGRERGANRSLFCDSERLVARPLLDDTDSLVTLPLLDDRPRSALPSNDDEVFYSICDNDAEESPDDCGDDDLLLEGINDNTILPPDDSETDASCLRHRHTSSSSVTSISNQEEMPSILDIPDPRTNSNHLRSDECV